MSNRVTGKALKTIAAISLVVAGSAALSGCTTLGSRAFGDQTVTGSVRSNGAGNLNQPMPSRLGSTKVASGPFIPPEDIGGGSSSGGGDVYVTGNASARMPQGRGGSVSSEDLPVLASSSNGNSKMSALPNVAPVTQSPKTATLGSAPSNLNVVPANAYVHVIESGESLYTIARRYDVTAQAVMQSNGLSSPDKIYVGQKLIIPGRADLLSRKDAAKAPTITAEVKPVTVPQQPAVKVASVDAMPPMPKMGAPKAMQPVVNAAPEAKPMQQPVQEPKLSGADKFRWPVSGKVITNFAASKGTGINIEASEGSAIRAAENGQVIYVGSGVEGYGNLILIRHPNGYVSAYAHLRDMNVKKGDVVNRGDNIGAAGATGSVTKPQLHFELRKGATPVDPMPLLAS